MGKVKKLFTNVRIIILIVALVLMVVAMHPNPYAEGATIRNVILNSSASDAGVENPKPTTPPMSRERIIAINNQPVRSIEDYYAIESAMAVNRTYVVKTTKGTYSFRIKPLTRTVVLNETEDIIVPQIREVNLTINGTTSTINETFNVTETVNKTRAIVIGQQAAGLSVYPSPQNNIRKGLDLEGGTRVLLAPEKEVGAEDMDLIIANMKQRLNVYGLSDVIVRPSRDLEGKQFILVEIPGANEEEVKELLAKQGKFEAKIAGTMVFRGGTDITYVCRSADCSGIDPYQGCGQVDANTWACRFRFAITLSPEAAERQANQTGGLSVIIEGSDEYLNDTIDLFLDDALVDSLNIGSDLKGRAVTDIQISGSGAGSTEQEAMFDSLANMKRLQTILITGSLPVKLEIVKTDTISPVLGDEFTKSAILMGLFAILAVGVVVFIRYRRLIISFPVMITMLSEAVLLLGLAALIGWKLDLAAIAGILIAIGTGVDDQIVIVDETLKKESQEAVMNWKQRIKRAFFIIMASYFTTVVAMIPLLFAGAGLLKGFAITTIAGVSFGVFVTRPAFAAVVEIFIKE